MTNKTLNTLKADREAVGIAIGNNCPLIVENVCNADIDFILMDRQHGMWSLDNLTYACRFAYTNHVTPMVRVRKNDFSEIGHVLDRGVLGVVVPMVNTREEALEAVYASYYPPKGGRSMGAFATSFLGENYVDQIQDNIFLGVQIETEKAIKNLKQILAVEGISGCLVGPADLAKDLGIENGCKEHEEIIIHILKTCLEMKKIPGILGGKAKYWFEKGYKLAITGSENGYIINGLKADLQKLKSL